MIEVELDPGGLEAAPGRLLVRAARTVLEAEGVEDGVVSIALLDDDAIRALNRTHLSRDRVTDVIAFALHDEDRPVVGDVYVGWEQAGRQGADAGVTLDEELVRLVVHGILHVLGWDHPEEAEARGESPMYRRQEELVRELGFPSAGGG